MPNGTTYRGETLSDRDAHELAAHVVSVTENPDREAFALPVNALTGHEYRGNNIARLLLSADEHGYQGPEWAGFTQWRQLGRTVRRGEHGTACLTVVTVAGEDGKGTRKPRGFRVFHYDQTEALPAEGEPAAPVVRVVDVDTRLAEAAEQIAALSRG